MQKYEVHFFIQMLKCLHYLSFEVNIFFLNISKYTVFSGKQIELGPFLEHLN